MYSQWELEKALPKLREAFSIGISSTKTTKSIKDFQNLSDSDAIRLFKDVDIQQGHTLNKLMVEGVDVIEMKPLGKFKTKEVQYKERGNRLASYFERIDESSKSNEQ